MAKAGPEFLVALDFDDTISIGKLPREYIILEATAKLHGLSLPDEGLIRDVYGYSREVMNSFYWPELIQDSAMFRTVLNSMHQIEKQLDEQGALPSVYLANGVMDAASDIRKMKGSIGIFSAKDADRIKYTAERIGLEIDRNFDFCIGGNLRYPKGTSLFFVPLINRLGAWVASTPSFYVGDALPDYLSVIMSPRRYPDFNIDFIGVTTGALSYNDWIVLGLPKNKIMSNIADLPNYTQRNLSTNIQNIVN
ncbi:MAG: hypothetical protein HY364_01130 [Candidatus Aenigmarchaeota archaeon]|nr:hypothetical protein [Candidatus Aenigmarchaeota archaeon]